MLPPVTSSKQMFASTKHSLRTDDAQRPGKPRSGDMPQDYNLSQEVFQINQATKARVTKRNKPRYVLKPDQRYPKSSTEGNQQRNPYIFLPYYFVHGAEPRPYTDSLCQYKSLDEIALDTVAGFVYREHNTGKSVFKGGGFSLGRGNHVSGERAVRDCISRRRMPCKAGSKDPMSRTVLDACTQRFVGPGRSDATRTSTKPSGRFFHGVSNKRQFRNGCTAGKEKSDYYMAGRGYSVCL